MHMIKQQTSMTNSLQKEKKTSDLAKNQKYVN